MLGERSQRNTDTIWYHLSVESPRKNVKLIETEEKNGYQGRGGRGNRERLVKGYKLSATR